MTLANPHLDRAAVPPVDGSARAFHRGLDDYAPTPLRTLGGFGGVAEVQVKDENGRLGLPAFKALGASWALERALREHPGTEVVVAASAGNHGRAVARMAARRGLTARIYVPARSLQARREAIRSEGAELIVVDGSYEDAVAASQADGALEIADVGDSGPAHWVIDGYATLFAELDDAAARADAEVDAFTRRRAADVLLVPCGVGSLAAAAARWGAANEVAVVAVEPETAACLQASLAAGQPTAIETPGTAMAGMDCAEVSAAAWPSLKAGIAGVVTVADDDLPAAGAVLETAGMDAGECAAATVAALERLLGDADAAELRSVIGLDSTSRVVLVGTEGPTSRLVV